jgi:hypothetical protein
MPDFKLKRRHVPWLLFGVCLLAYGVLINTLGFYWDDWEILYLSSAARRPADIFLFPFRPVHVWLDILTVDLLGFRPLNWHILMLVIRFLGGLVFWRILERLWPKREIENAWTAVLFLVYPAFIHQSMAVVYRQHFTTALLYLVSLWLMILGVQSWQQAKRGKGAALIMTGVAAACGHLFLMEYFAGLELLRPLILALLILRTEKHWKPVLGKVVAFWLPYAAVTVYYFLWRLLLVPGEVDDLHAFVLLDLLRESPLRAILAVVQSALLDFTHLFLGSWYQIFDPQFTDLSMPVSLMTFVLMAVAAGGLGWLFSRFHTNGNIDPGADRRATREVVIVGLAATVLGLAPAWLLGRDVFTGRYDTRFSIPALMGVAILFVAFFFFISGTRQRTIWLLAVLVSMAIGRQVRMTNDFRWDWERQSRIYWQLHTRIPDLEPGTAILANRSVSNFTTTYPAAYAANFLYGSDAISLRPAHWWFEIYDSRLFDRTDELLSGGLIRTRFHMIEFDAPGSDSVVISLPALTEPTQCVWLLTPLDTANQQISPEMRALAPLSDPSRIITSTDALPPTEIFGQPPKPGWCMYYQQASLAAQNHDWAAVIGFYEEMIALSNEGDSGYEYLPYIEAFAMQDDWQKAVDLTIQAENLTKSSAPMLCAAWMDWDLGEEESPDYLAAYQQVVEAVGCTE